MYDRNLTLCLEIPTTNPNNTKAKIKDFMEVYIQNLHQEKIQKKLLPYLDDLSFKDVAKHFANDQLFEEKCSINS